MEVISGAESKVAIILSSWSCCFLFFSSLIRFSTHPASLSIASSSVMLHFSQGLKFAQEMYRKLTAWDNEVLCGSDDPHEVDRIVDWVYEGITKGRSYGAIIGEMHDKTYEAKITELEQELERWKQAHERVKQDNIILANELVDRQNIIDAYESTFGVRKDDINKE
jgi:hypothetical protein